MSDRSNIRSYLPRSEARKLVDCIDQVGVAKEVLARTVTPRDQAQTGLLRGSDAPNWEPRTRAAGTRA